MERKCGLDMEYASQILALLQSPPSNQAQEYFDYLIATRQCNGITVQLHGLLGKGVYADTDFEDEQLVLKDQMLVGSQHSTNKLDCFVCGYCFRYLGSIELQIGRKLYLESLGESLGNNSHTHDEEDHFGECSSSDDRIPLSPQVIESLTDGQLVLPYSDKFPLPSPVSCSGRCGEENYCSQYCAEMDWETSHSLLCIGEKSKSSYHKAMSMFVEHAIDTNDIFIVAAKVIAMTILRYKKLKEARLREIDSKSISNATVDMPLLLEAWKPVSMGYKGR